jgi:hypothetical protein
MSEDIERAKLENYVESMRVGLIHMINGAMEGIRARIPGPTLPPSPRTHELKSWPQFFEGSWDKSKLAELRKNDRAFGTGDVLELREFKPMRGVHEEGHYTGRWVTARVLRVDHLAHIVPGHVLLSLSFIAKGNGHAVAAEMAPGFRIRD